MKNTGKIFELVKGRVLPAFLAAVIVPAVFTGCSKKSSAAASSGESLPLTIIYTSNVVGAPVVTLAKEKHYSEEEGLKPEYIILSSGAIEALSIGKADVMLNGLVPPLSFASYCGRGTERPGGYRFCKL
ncbi:MAG: hypothetical protein LBQ14_07765 [Treponema sp.]|nr:hypothetical protein [Treponema sp.]